MKRGSSGTKRKQAAPVSKPAAKRPVVRAKTKSAKAKTTKLLRAANKVKAAAKGPAKKVISRSKPALKKKTVVTVSKAKKSSRPPKAAPKKQTRESLKRPAISRRPAVKGKKVSLAPVLASVPGFLLEGDEPGFESMGGLAEKFSLGPTPPLDHFAEAQVPLPESYGTGKLFLTARDPHWLYAHWDFTREEQFRHNARSVDRHLVLRVHDGATNRSYLGEYHVHPESKHWFVHVDHAGESYRTELGYYQPGRKWKSLAFSAPQRTPPNNISTDVTVKFATIPVEIPFETMLSWLKEAKDDTAAQNIPLAHVVDKIRPRAREHSPKSAPAKEWTPEQEQALAGRLAVQTGVSPSSSAGFATEKTWSEFVFDLEHGAAGLVSSPSSYTSSCFGAAPWEPVADISSEETR